MREIPLTQGLVAQVDDADFKWLSQWKWCAQRIGHMTYAKRGGQTKGKQYTIFMHVALIGSGVDHIDRCGLNNQRNNLRRGNNAQNGCNRGPNLGNRSGLKGVSWHNRDRVYRARITVHRKEKHLGFFHNPLDAARAYDAAALKYQGQFACTNKSLGLLKG